MAVLEVRGLSKHFGGLAALSDQLREVLIRRDHVDLAVALPRSTTGEWADDIVSFAAVFL